MLETKRAAQNLTRLSPILLVIVILAVTLMPQPQVVAAAPNAAIPTFSIVGVNPGVSVTIRTANFPANQLFTVRMGAYGTLGIGGTVVATTNSGAGGTFEETYSIPASLASADRIAIRMDSAGGYYSYNWFWNTGVTPTVTPGGPTVTPVPGGYTGIPTFSIIGVVRDVSVTIRTNNFPANQNFTVRMGPYGTLGLGGTVVTTTSSGAGGAFDITYNIPAGLVGSDRIAIRMDSPAGYFSYNWFWNSSTGVEPSVTPGGPTLTPSNTPPAPYTGIPTFSVIGVVRDSTVTIRTNNFPSNQEFTVRMGAYGTLALGGTVVATTNSGAGGAFEATYNIPAGLVGSDRIAIRMDAPSGYYSFNWFWNSSTGAAPTVTPGGATVTPGGPTVTPSSTPIPDYTGIPTFSIIGVTRDVSVTIRTNNFPPNQEFTVRMGPFGTLGLGGTVITTTNSGAGGAFEATYNIPAGLVGSDRIAIRMDSNAGYFAYNWFWNNTFP